MMHKSSIYASRIGYDFEENRFPIVLYASIWTIGVRTPDSGGIGCNIIGQI
jgi:hypothetical protein